MDVVTHLALGVCTSELWLRKKAGKKILIFGAFVQALPDIDTVAALYMPADRSLLIHRGITHSVVFALLAGLLLAWLAFPAFKSKGIAFISLFFFCCFQLSLHDMLDVCNAYGTGLFEPFSHHRFSANLLYVADPFFTIALIIGALVLLIKSDTHPSRAKWAWAALLVPVIYLCYAGMNKAIVDSRVAAVIKTDQMHSKGYFTTPAPLNSMLWYVVINSDSCYYTGYTSVFDRNQPAISLGTYPKNYALLKAVQGKHAIQNFKDFAAGYYTVSGSGDSLYINIIRFGQLQGWKGNNAPFVLSCPLLENNSRALALQKGRLTGWNIDAMKHYIRRIAGNRQ